MSTTPDTIATPDESRHNMYYAIHRGLRFGHARMLSAIGANDFARDRETAELIGELRGFLALGQGHLAGEDREIHSAMDARAPGSTAHAADEHDHHEMSFAEIEALLQRIERAAAKDRPALGRALYRRYALFMAADLEHMHGEETVLLRAMHDNFSDDELRAIEHRIVSAIPPAKMMVALRYILPALNLPERIGMLRGMQQALPAEAFAAVMREVVSTCFDRPVVSAIEAALQWRQAA